jgi:hypothetical protein
MYKISKTINGLLFRVDYEGCVNGAPLADYLETADGIFTVTQLTNYYKEKQGYLLVKVIATEPLVGVADRRIIELDYHCKEFFRI